MDKTALKNLIALLQRKQRAEEQNLADLQTGDTIELSLTALETATLKFLLWQAIEEMSPLATLIEQAKAVFFSEIGKRRTELLALPEGYALSKVSDELGLILDSLLDEDKAGATLLFLYCCIERPDLFTTQPPAVSCVTDQAEHGNLTAQHVAYHQLYDVVRATLELAFLQWHQEHSRDE